MSEEQYRRAIVVILMTFLHLVVIFITMYADTQRNLAFQDYSKKAIAMYADLQTKLIEYIK